MRDTVGTLYQLVGATLGLVAPLAMPAYAIYLAIKK
jgi:hypothetical protein